MSRKLTQEQEQEAYRTIAQMVEIHGEKNLNCKTLSAYNPLVYSRFTKCMGGFKKLKADISSGRIVLRNFLEQNVTSPSPGCISPMTAIIPAPEQAGLDLLDDKPEQSQEVTSVEQVTEPVKPSPPQPTTSVEEMQSEAQMAAALRQLFQNEEKVQAMIKAKSVIPTDYQRLFENLEKCEKMFQETIRERTVNYILKYAVNQYGRMDQSAVQLAYADVYNALGTLYGFSVAAYYKGWIDAINTRRSAAGKKPIGTHQKGYQKIDFIERLGLDVELLSLVESMVKELEERNATLFHNMPEV